MSPEQREPVWITLNDLMALVLGAALAAAIPWQFWPQILARGGLSSWWTDFRAPVLMNRMIPIAELLSHACLALVPAVVARRARYGGVARPAEFLAAACALPLLQRATDLTLFTMRAGFDPRNNWFGPRLLPNAESLQRDELWAQWQTEMTWPWTTGLFAIACAASLTLALTWGRWPGWIRTVLLLLAWFGLTRAAWMGPANLLPFERAAKASAAVHVLNHVGFYAIGVLPYKLLTDVPAGAAWLRLRNPHAPRPNWLERVGLGLVGCLFLATMSQHALRMFAPPPMRGHWTEFAAHLTTTVIAIAIGLWIARRWLPGWSGPPGRVWFTPQETAPGLKEG